MARNTELSNVDGHHKSRKSTSTEAGIERLLRSLDARGYDISGVGALEADRGDFADRVVVEPEDYSVPYTGSLGGIHVTPPDTGPYARVFSNPDQSDGNMHRHFYDENGEHVCSVGYHTHPDGSTQHWKVYTAQADLTALPLSRFTIGSGSDAVTSEFSSTEYLNIEGRDSDSFVRVRANNETGTTYQSGVELAYRDDAGNLTAAVQFRQDQGVVQLNDPNGPTFFEYQPGDERVVLRGHNVNLTSDGNLIARTDDGSDLEMFGDLDMRSQPLRGVRDVGASPATSDLSDGEIAFTSDRDGNSTPAWLYDDGTNVHYWDADGTL